MLISKFDLYKAEWLELVFNDRNKEYGAYELRHRYADNMVRAMGITFFTIALLCAATIIFRGKPADRMIVVTVDPTIPNIQVIHPPVKRAVQPPVRPIKQVTPVNPPPMTRVVELVVAPDTRAVEPPKNEEITGAIGTTTTPGTGTGTSVLESPGDGTGTKPAPDETIHTVGGLDVMPEPVGGEKAWAKFLNKNLRFPYAAQEEGVSGRVILSFVIEKDGSLSNISVERQAGHGFDEEALRVLKLAKAWKPGMQNGQPVRVRYDIPINFQLSSDNN